MQTLGVKSVARSAVTRAGTGFSIDYVGK